ncbi:MAG: hypothetical protein EOP88_11200 [Verrucomicrobiaceae bacterium]|nr:MAG: hypothetical protein EOP88_11200 [Verrucomicrobiaceae bacterium]
MSYRRLFRHLVILSTVLLVLVEWQSMKGHFTRGFESSHGDYWAGLNPGTTVLDYARIFQATTQAEADSTGFLQLLAFPEPDSIRVLGGPGVSAVGSMAPVHRHLFRSLPLHGEAHGWREGEGAGGEGCGFTKGLVLELSTSLSPGAVSIHGDASRRQVSLDHPIPCRLPTRTDDSEWIRKKLISPGNENRRENHRLDPTLGSYTCLRIPRQLRGKLEPWRPRISFQKPWRPRIS